MTYFVFDMGQVLLHFEPLFYLLPAGFPIQDVLELNTLIFKGQTWHEIDAGLYSIDEATNLFASRSTLDKNLIRKVLTEWSDGLMPYPTTENILQRLVEAGYDLYYLTNFPDYAFDRTFERLSLLKYFKGGICSAKVKLAKPDPAIFELLFASYDLRPEEGVFIDDKAANIETAKKLGMETLHYKETRHMADLIGRYT